MDDSKDGINVDFRLNKWIRPLNLIVFPTLLLGKFLILINSKPFGLYNVQGSSLSSICKTNIYNKPTPLTVLRVFSCYFGLQNVPTTKPGIKRVKSEWL